MRNRIGPSSLSDIVPAGSDLHDPSLGSFDASHLDAGKSIVQFLYHGSHLLHSALKTDLLAMVIDQAHGRDDGCGTAESAFLEVGDFCQRDFPLNDFQAEIVLW